MNPRTDPTPHFFWATSTDIAKRKARVRYDSDVRLYPTGLVRPGQVRWVARTVGTG